MFFGVFLGKGGETIRSMSRMSKAKIIVDRSEEKRQDGMKQVELIGTMTQIVSAKVNPLKSKPVVPLSMQAQN